MAIKRADEPTAFDPQADLDLLERSKKSVAVNDILDIGPWWYAPLFAISTGGFALTFAEFGVLTEFGFLVTSFGICGIVAAHDHGRRKVRPKFSGRALWAELAALLFFCSVVWLWEMAIARVGNENFFVLPALAAWALTTVAYLAVRHLCHSRLERRRALV